MVGVRLFSILLSVLVVLVAIASAGPESDASSFVLDLTANNFQQEVESSEDIVFVEFYAPWCGHCKKLLPELEEAARQLRGMSGVKIAKMDADTRAADKAVAKRFGIKGYPSLMIWRRGRLFADYGRGGRTARHIVSYIRRLQTPTVIALSADESDVKKFVSGGNGDNPSYVLIGGGANHRASKAFAVVAETVREHTWFGHIKLDDKNKNEDVIPSDVAAALSLSAEQRRGDTMQLPAVVAVHETTGAEVYAGDVADTAALKTFVNHTRLPLVMRLEQAVFPIVANSNRATVLLLVSGGANGMTSGAKTPMTGTERDVAQHFLEVAKVHRAAAHFATVDMFLLGPWVKHEMGLEPGKGGMRLPSVMVYHKKNHSMWFDPTWRERGDSVNKALESLIRDTVYEKTLAPKYVKTTPVIYKLEREIEKRPNIIFIVALVPIVIVLCRVFFSTSSTSTSSDDSVGVGTHAERRGGRRAGKGTDSGVTGGEETEKGQGAVVKTGAEKVRQRR